MKLRNLFASLIIAGSLLGCGELETQVKTFTSVRGDLITIKRVEVKGKTMFDIQKEIIAVYDTCKSKYVNQDYFPILTINIRERNKEEIYYVDEKNDGTVDAYIINGKTFDRTQNSEINFLNLDKKLAEYKSLLDVEETIKKLSK
ncbi:hypothetical protein HZA97_04815 [Candidatus Woesearchaeota archaeon]|nr:hypothetical protein [Candidatus Woesearchaeota archaeon]